MKRGLAALGGVALAGVVVVAVAMRSVGDDPDVWHVDPATAARTGRTPHG